ncbi:MAG: pyrroline-5-carboxylate reductase [Aquificota bacterium]|nr:MAG: pyrroline-5-carboxylate reductase [Aquificota bacterium]
MFKVGIIGGGNIGEAIIKGILNGKKVSEDKIIVSDINGERVKYLVEKYHIAGTDSNERVARLSEIVILAVKPKDFERSVSPIKEELNGKILISVLAGVKIEKIKKVLGENIKIVRVMPNTPALVGEGAIGVSFEEGFTEEERKKVLSILETLGTVVEVKEELMDVITGLSGSGPAYVFTFIDALAQGGVKGGLSYNDALKLAVQTVLGAAKLLKETGEHPAVLRDKVTSPAGTTIYGLHALEKGSFRNTVINAVEEATKRSKELG